MRKPWTLDDALALVVRLHEPLEAAGFYPGLTGSVLWNGKSDNDLDLIVYPKCKGEGNEAAVFKALFWEGFRLCLDEHGVQEIWKTKGSHDTKRVQRWIKRKRC